ncbi:MAG TPA: hypothetical protein VFM63_06515 [Pyrinomonadaceae bacterium]|nr:hypothetical protein [Pyrinomonadaceae bacterium]
MKKQHTAGRYSIFGLILLLSAAAPALAQRPAAGPPPIDKHTNAARKRQQDTATREWQLRNFGNPEVTKDRRRLEALMAQTEEDFTRMLTLHNEIARALAATKPLDYRFVSEATGEIRKRAHSIQGNLVLTPSEEELKRVEMPEVLNESEMKDGLVKLCKQIRSFVTNPVIEQPNLIDADKLVAAKRDLESVIQLSAQLKKDADHLSGKVQK